MTSLSDEALIAEFLASGDQALLNDLFSRYYLKVGAWCFRIMGDRETAADLAQEIFVKVQRHLQSFRGTAKFSTWLYSIVRNHCYNAARARSAQPDFLGSEALDPLAGSADLEAHAQFQRKADAELLRSLMHSNLEELEISAMTLHYFDEIPLNTISRLLRLTNVSGAKALIVSARRKLSAAVSGQARRVSSLKPIGEEEHRL